MLELKNKSINHAFVKINHSTQHVVVSVHPVHLVNVAKFHFMIHDFISYQFIYCMCWMELLS